MKSTIRTITPDQAALWLRPDVNRDNRPLRQSHVAFLAREMDEGRWQSTHQGIAFAEGGRLLDGQHRLAAIVRVGKSMDIMVTTGLAEESFSAIDGGLKRANYDRIHLVDNQNQNKLICQAIRAFISETTKDNAVSVGHIEDEFLARADAWMWVGVEFDGISGRLKKAGVMAAIGVYRFVKPEKAAQFMEGYREGTDLTPGSPILKLRNDALVGTARDCAYWRAQSIMRSHLHGKIVDRVFVAAQDMLGNENTSRTIKERSEARRLGALNHQKRRGVA